MLVASQVVNNKTLVQDKTLRKGKDKGRIIKDKDRIIKDQDVNNSQTQTEDVLTKATKIILDIETTHLILFLKH
jgi:hypothetical protein